MQGGEGGRCKVERSVQGGEGGRWDNCLEVRGNWGGGGGVGSVEERTCVDVVPSLLGRPHLLFFSIGF